MHVYVYYILDTNSYSFVSEQIKIEQISEINSVEFEEIEIEKVVKKTHKDVVVKDVFRHNWTKKLTLNKPVPKSQLCLGSNQKYQKVAKAGFRFKY